MNRFFPLIVALLFVAPSRTPAEETDAQTTAKSAAYDLAAAFSNEGFKTRYGAFFGSSLPGAPSLVKVNLFAGNEYWFSAATGSGGKIEVRVYDEEGQPIESEVFAEEGRAAAGIGAAYSGAYYIEVAAESAPAAFCLVYSYK